MSDLPESRTVATEGDATQALDALRAEVLSVHVAIAELAKSVNESRPVDYTLSLGKIAKGLAQVIERRTASGTSPETGTASTDHR